MWFISSRSFNSTFEEMYLLSNGSFIRCMPLLDYIHDMAMSVIFTFNAISHSFKLNPSFKQSDVIIIEVQTSTLHEHVLYFC